MFRIFPVWWYQKIHNSSFNQECLPGLFSALCIKTGAATSNITHVLVSFSGWMLFRNGPENLFLKSPRGGLFFWHSWRYCGSNGTKFGLLTIYSRLTNFLPRLILISKNKQNCPTDPTCQIPKKIKNHLTIIFMLNLKGFWFGFYRDRPLPLYTLSLRPLSLQTPFALKDCDEMILLGNKCA